MKQEEVNFLLNVIYKYLKRIYLQAYISGVVAQLVRAQDS